MLNYLNRSENSVAILFVLSLISLIIPYGMPLFGAITFLFVCLKFISGKIKIRLNLGISLFYLIVVFYFIGLMWTDTMYTRVKVDLTNIAGYVLLWILLSDLNLDNYKRLLHNIAKYTVVVVFPVSLFALYKFISLTNGNHFEFLYANDGRYPEGTSLMLDYNMFSLGIIPALLFSLYFLIQEEKTSKMIFYFVSFSSTFTTILLAGSRRAWIVAAVIFIYALVVFIRYLLRERPIKIFKFVFSTTYILVFIALIGVLFGFSDRFTNNFFDSSQFQRIEKRFNSISDGSFGTREIRYDYAYSLILQQSPLENIIGSGFDYIGKFGDRFNSTSGENYPHNPFLSSILYSGVLGTLTLVTLLIWSVVHLVNRFNVIGFNTSLYYLITWMFVFISGNSIFSIRIFSFMLLIIFAAPTFKRITKDKPNPLSV